jgi:hypothetical protein
MALEDDEVRRDAFALLNMALHDAAVCGVVVPVFH